MTTLSFQWLGPKDLLARFSCAPVWIMSDEAELLLAPGERIEIAKGAKIVAEVPGYERSEQEVQILDERPMTVSLNIADLAPRPQRAQTPGKENEGDSSVAIDVRPWNPLAATIPQGSADIRLAKAVGCVFTICRTAGEIIPLSLSVASKSTPRRQLAVPPAVNSASYRINWYQSHASVARPRLEPEDPEGWLLMEYLLSGKYAAAAAAARAVELSRGARSCLSWSAESYTQLLIGHAYALGGDSRRLMAWCRRTAAARLLGTDGLILAAEAAWKMSDRRASLKYLTRAANLPPATITFSVELGLRLASIQLSEVLAGEECRDAAVPAHDTLIRLRNDCLTILTHADADSATISLPQTSITSPDLSGVSVFRRGLWRLTYGISRWSYDYVLRSTRTGADHHFQLGGTMAASTTTPEQGGSESVSTSSLQGPALWVAISAVVAWLALSIYLLTRAGSAELEWTRTVWVFASVEAIAFAAAGALFGTAVQRSHVAQAEKRAQSAEQVADQNRDEANKGRALAAAMQADATEDQTVGRLTPMGPQDESSAEHGTRRRHAQMARSLFGDLVPPIS